MYVLLCIIFVHVSSIFSPFWWVFFNFTHPQHRPSWQERARRSPLIPKQGPFFWLGDDVGGLPWASAAPVPRRAEGPSDEGERFGEKSAESQVVRWISEPSTEVASKKIAESQKYMVFQPSIFGGGTLSFGVLIKERKKEGEEERNWDEMLDDFLVEWNSICTDVRHLHTSFHLTIAFDEISTVFSTNVNHFGFQNFGLRRCFTFYHNKSL